MTFAGGGINIWCGRESTGGGESFQVWRGERANFWWVGRGPPPLIAMLIANPDSYAISYLDAYNHVDTV